MPARDDQPMMDRLRNWAWVLAETRAAVAEPCRAPIIAIRTQEVWLAFLWRRRNSEDA